MTERTVQIVILNDNVVESVEQFSVTIVAVEGLFPVEVIDAVAVVEITDNDGKSWGATHWNKSTIIVTRYEKTCQMSGFFEITLRISTGSYALFNRV